MSMFTCPRTGVPASAVDSGATTVPSGTAEGGRVPRKTSSASEVRNVYTL